MSDAQIDALGLRVQRLAADLPYPPTPNVAAVVATRIRPGQDVPPARSYRRLAGIVVALSLAAVLALAVPQVRAAIIDFIQIGVVRVFPVAPTVTPTATGTATVPGPTPTLLPALFNLAGRTTLAQAQANAGFDIKLPASPVDLGQPDVVFLQNFEGAMVVMVWLDEDDPKQIRMSLHAIEPGSYALTKAGPEILEETTVNGQVAYWAEGPYMLQMRNGDMDIRRLIAGHVLIWVDDTITYRLETHLSMDEAIKVAESLELGEVGR